MVLTLHVLPPGVDDPVDPLVAAWREFLDGARPLVAGGFARARVERFDGHGFASNQRGGFRVGCPRDGRNLVPAFNRAYPAWREGGPRALACDCGERHDLADLRYAPDAGFARGWIALAGAGDADVTPEARAVADAAVGRVRIVLRRG
ncbi:MAG: hypothetical protein ACOZNI_15210 [Myxococcota bacterium]